MEGIKFAHPHTLFDSVGKVLEEVGPEKFFSSPDERVKKAREGFAAYFFTLAMKGHTGKDWWLAHPNQAERSYPDFDFICFGERPEDMKLEPVELTGVYPHFQTFDEALKIVNKKQKQYGDQLVKFSLLVFVNHAKSEEWIRLLREAITTEYPFLSIWTVHLLFKQSGMEVSQVVAQRIRPRPSIRIVVDTDDPKINRPQSLPSCFEEKIENGTRYVLLKRNFVDQFMEWAKGRSKQ